MDTKNDIRVVVERLCTMAAGGPVNTKEKLNVKFSNAVNQIERIYDVNLDKPSELTVDQIVDICYNTNRHRALLKIKQYINEYQFNVADVFPPDEGVSIH